MVFLFSMNNFISGTQTAPQLTIGAEIPVYRIADDRVEVRPSEGLVVADGAVLEEIRGAKLEVLSLLASHPDSTVTNTMLYQHLWGSREEVTSNTVRVHVSNLRQILGPELGDADMGAIITRRGVGYRAVSSLGQGADLLADAQKPGYFIADERIEVSAEGFFVKQDGALLEDITLMELKLLAELAGRPDRVVGTRALTHAVWGVTNKHTVDAVRVHISNIRKKLGSELGDNTTGAIRTRQGIGYYAVSSLSIR